MTLLVRSVPTEPLFYEIGLHWRRLGEEVDTYRNTLVTYHKYNNPSIHSNAPSRLTRALIGSPGWPCLVLASAPTQLDGEQIRCERIRSVARFALNALEQSQGTTTAMASMVVAQAGARLFHKKIPGYAPPDPVYETYMDKDGEEKTRKVRLDPLRLHPRLTE